MIRRHKYQQALRALSSILARARWMAQEAEAAELAELLDAAEILPKYIAQDEDVTEDFRMALNDISSQFTTCSHLIDEFDESCVNKW